MRRVPGALWLGAMLLPGVAACATLGPAATHGVMAAEVTSTSAIVWSRTDRPATMHVRVIPAHVAGKLSTAVAATGDYTGQIELRGLQPATRYRYDVWFTAADNDGDTGAAGSPLRYFGFFATAPAADAAAAVRLVWSGDFAGQNVCRDVREGFPIFAAIAREKADAFIGLGDMIYADHVCEKVGRYGNEQVPGDFVAAVELDDFRAHWRYTHADAGFQALLAGTAYYGVWDDHEVVNDFGPLHDTHRDPSGKEQVSLLATGLRAFLEYTPLTRRAAAPDRLYRSVRRGRHAELFLLDNRQYRDANLAADREDRPKTMLGREQLAWLKNKLQDSDATWKIVVSSVPISIPTGYPAETGRDGWANFDRNTEPTVDGIPQSATGFERELAEIMTTLRDARSNALFITTDVHFAEVFRYTPDSTDEGFTVHEIAVGPGNAGIFPSREFDTSFGTRSLFFFGPRSAAAVSDWSEAKKWFNYGVIDIQPDGTLTATIKDTAGTAVYTLTLKP